MGTSHKGNPEEQSQIQTPTAFTYRLQHPWAICSQEWKAWGRSPGGAVFSRRVLTPSYWWQPHLTSGRQLRSPGSANSVAQGKTSLTLGPQTP
jgi:hypothetical protein